MDNLKLSSILDGLGFQCVEQWLLDAPSKKSSGNAVKAVEDIEGIARLRLIVGVDICIDQKTFFLFRLGKSNSRLEREERVTAIIKPAVELM